MAPRNGSATHAHARTLHEQMNGLFFYIGLGIGLAAACGLRPYLPTLLAVALGSAGALGIAFTGHFAFLQAGWWLVAVTVVFVGSYLLQRRLGQERFQAVVQPAIVAQAVAVGALLFAGTLAAHGDAWWPGLIGGAAAAALGLRASGPIVLGARSRLPDRAAREALTIYLDAAALLLAALVALLHPLGYVLLILLAVLLVRTRQRAGEKYAGLRILGR
jgi:drug/metabolite transporter (DMT)-like permease